MPLPANTTDYAKRHYIADAFENVIVSLTLLIESYENTPMALWSQAGISDLNWLRHVLLDLWYQDGQPGNHSRQHVGVVGATEQQLALLGEVNRAKRDFTEAMSTLRHEDRRTQRTVRFFLEEVARDRRELLGYSGLGRLHLKQCWRQLQCAETRCRLISFSWYVSGRSIYRRTVSEVDKMLADFHNDDAPHIRIQRAQLATLPKDEPLAQVLRQAPIMRANALYETPTEELKTRRMFSISMPLFVPLEPGESLPSITAPDATPPSERVRPVRSDVRLESEPFIPSLHIYRYRSQA